MSGREMSDREIKADFMNKLFRKNCWGSRYLPLDTLVRWMSSKVKRNGRRVRAAVRQLANDGYIIFHKRGETVSLNPSKSREITEFITNFLS